MARIVLTKALVAHVATVLIAAVALAGLGLSGTAVVKSYADCVSNAKTETGGGTEGKDPGNLCGKDYMPALWVLLLEILVLAATLVGTGTGLAQKFHYGLVGFLVLACAGVIDWAEHTLLGDESHMPDKSLEKVAASGFTILAVVNVGLILWLGVQRVKGSTSGLRPVRECTPQRFSIFLFVTFGVCVGSFMVAAALESGSSEKQGLKWWGICSVLVTMVAVAVGEAFGILENFGPTLSALVALAAATTMDITDMVMLDLDGSVPGNILAGGFIILSIMCLGVILLLGLMSPGTPEGEEVLGCSTHLVAYTALPLLFGSALTVVGVAKHNSNDSCDTDPDSCLGNKANYVYWTIALEVFAVILTFVGKKNKLEKLKVPSLLFIVLATICHMVKAGLLLKEVDLNLGLAAAGFVITIAMNFILIGLLGYEGDSDFGGFLRLEA